VKQNAADRERENLESKVLQPPLLFLTTLCSAVVVVVVSAVSDPFSILICLVFFFFLPFSFFPSTLARHAADKR
jgi:hypothetical protein